MKRKVILSLLLAIIGLVPALAQPPSPIYPFSMSYDSSLNLMTVVSEPPGFTRYPDAKVTPFQLWLTNLPLLPLNIAVARWDGQIIMRADSTGGVIDFGVGSENQKDADIPLQLLLEYLRVRGSLGNYPIIIRRGDTLTYNKWLNGIYSNGPRNELFYTPGEKREASEMEYYRYLQLIITENDGKSLIKNLIPVDDNNIAPGTIFVQFRKDVPDSTGHTAVILDVCTNPKGELRILAGWGGDPAQSFFVARPLPISDRVWFTLEEFKQRLQKYGEGNFYRFPNR